MHSTQTISSRKKSLLSFAAHMINDLYLLNKFVKWINSKSMEFSRKKVAVEFKKRKNSNEPQLMLAAVEAGLQRVHYISAL